MWYVVWHRELPINASPPNNVIRVVERIKHVESSNYAVDGS